MMLIPGKTCNISGACRLELSSAGFLWPLKLLVELGWFTHALRDWLRLYFALSICVSRWPASLTSLLQQTSTTDTAGASSCSFPSSAAQSPCTVRPRQMLTGRLYSAVWRALDSASVSFPLLWGRHSFFVIKLTWFQSRFRP